MGTKNNPGDFDCYRKAEPDEPMFILLARDLCAPETIKEWIRLRVVVAGGNTPFTEVWDDGGKRLGDKKLWEALDCAQAMKEWRAMNSRTASWGRSERGKLDRVHAVLSGGEGLSNDTFQTRCDAALKIIIEGETDHDTH